MVIFIEQSNRDFTYETTNLSDSDVKNSIIDKNRKIKFNTL